jgi:hypothetical protein
MKGRALTRPSKDQLTIYRKLLDDLALLDEAFNRMALTVAQTQVTDFQRQAFMLHVATAMRGTAGANQVILSWCVGEEKPSILFIERQWRRH